MPYKREISDFSSTLENLKALGQFLRDLLSVLSKSEQRLYEAKEGILREMTEKEAFSYGLDPKNANGVIIDSDVVNKYTKALKENGIPYSEIKRRDGKVTAIMFSGSVRDRVQEVLQSVDRALSTKVLLDSKNDIRGGLIQTNNIPQKEFKAFLYAAKKQGLTFAYEGTSVFCSEKDREKLKRTLFEFTLDKEKTSYGQYRIMQDMKENSLSRFQTAMANKEACAIIFDKTGDYIQITGEGEITMFDSDNPSGKIIADSNQSVDVKVGALASAMRGVSGTPAFIPATEFPLDVVDRREMAQAEIDRITGSAQMFAADKHHIEDKTAAVVLRLSDNADFMREFLSARTPTVDLLFKYEDASVLATPEMQAYLTEVANLDRSVSNEYLGRVAAEYGKHREIERDAVIGENIPGRSDTRTPAFGRTDEAPAK